MTSPNPAPARTTGSGRHVLVGAEGIGLAASLGLTVRPPVVTEFEAEASWATLHTVRLDRVISTGARLRIPAGTSFPAASRVESYHAVFLLSGASASEDEHLAEVDVVGGMRLFRAGTEVRVITPAASDRVIVTVPASALNSSSASALRRTGRMQTEATTLTRAAGALVATLLGSQLDDRSDAGSAVERVLLDLIDAAIEIHSAATHGSVGESVDGNVLRRALDVIAEQYRDPDLDSERIAEQLGVSVRRLQRIFGARDTSVSTEIRNHRLDTIAAALREEKVPPAINALVLATGFRSVDPVRRSFQARFGTTMREYRDARS